MSRAIHYCDYNAGAPLRPVALAAWQDVAVLGGNPSSIHGAGRQAKARLETARETLAAGVGAQAQNVVFTSGATEALQLALESCGAASVVVSSIEHDALWEHAPKVFGPVFVVPVTAAGLVDLPGLEALLRDAPKPALVCVMLANNETGAIQPLAQVAPLVRQAGGMLLVDACQAVGRIPVDLATLDATYLVLSSHKLGGPPGAGCLVLAPGAPFASRRAGGGQERGRRPGTENTPAIAGFAAAFADALAQMETERPRLLSLRDAFEAAVTGEGAFQIFSDAVPRLPNTSLVAMAGLRAETAVIGLDLAGFAVSSGAACSSGKVRASRVLLAMGVSEGLAGCALRASFGWGSTLEDALELAAAMRHLAARHTARAREGVA
jgi:cysteine desulfurase